MVIRSAVTQCSFAIHHPTMKNRTRSRTYGSSRANVNTTTTQTTWQLCSGLICYCNLINCGSFFFSRPSRAFEKKLESLAVARGEEKVLLSKHQWESGEEERAERAVQEKGWRETGAKLQSVFFFSFLVFIFVQCWINCRDCYAMHYHTGLGLNVIIYVSYARNWDWTTRHILCKQIS